MKIYEPNYTQIPNAIISMMPEFTESEFKVVMAICRKTLGWQKKRDRISLSQLQKMTGLGRASVCKAIKSENFKGIVKTYALDKGNEYELLIHELGSSKSEPFKEGVVQNINHGSIKSEPIGSSESEHTKETNKQTIQNNYVQFVDLWNEVNNCNLRITDKKREQIRARLRTYSEEELKQSIRNRSKNDWINGDGLKYKTDWNSFWRNDEKPERYLSTDSVNKIIDGGTW